MKISDIQIGQSAIIEVKPQFDDDFGEGILSESDASLICTETSGEYLVRVGQNVFQVIGVDDTNNRQLDFLVSQNLPRLCWVAGVFPINGPAQSLVLHIRSFPLHYPIPDRIRLGVSEKIVEQVSRNYLRRQQRVTTEEVIEWLVENTLFASDGNVNALISAGARRMTRLPISFTIHGKGVQVDVGAGSGQGYHVIRLSRRKAGISGNGAVMLLSGDLGYADVTAASRFMSEGKTILDSILGQANSYLSLWQKYNMLEQKEILRDAREFGWLSYTDRKQRENGSWRFSIGGRESSSEKLIRLHERVREGLQLEASDGIPPHLVNEPESSTIQQLEFSPDSNSRAFMGELINRDGWNVDLRPQDPDNEAEPPKKGCIYLALTGDRVRLQRREQARDRIASANTPMPWLAMLIEEGGAVPKPEFRRIRPAKKDVQKIFGGEPTRRQLEALETALNTPDIALIQGPPGTGKTRVIAALAALLAENHQADSVAGQILITSYQHDAVENAASRTRVMGLPAIKVGGKRAGNLTYDGVESWRSEQLQLINADLSKYPERPATTELRYMRQIAIAYNLTPGSSSESSKMLRDICDRTRPYISADLSERLLIVSHALLGKRTQRYKLELGRENLLRAVTALRYSLEEFLDDGPQNAYRLLKRLNESRLLDVEDSQIHLLRNASEWRSTSSPDFLEELQALREELLDGFVDSTVLDRAIVRNYKVEQLLSEVVNELNQYVTQSREGVEATIIEYCDELNYDPQGVKQTVHEYTAVLASTCQQSVSLAMDRIKDDKEFDTIIIDEAARANPLDLFIPMARAKRRIILVGDHRQLPHILEPNVERELQDAQESTRERLRESLFERLWIRAEQLQGIDGIHRRSSLDAQYRMHPTLGNFVSDTFYARYGENFDSPLPPNEFVHALPPYEGKIAVWKNIPREDGTEKGNRSKYRPAEAKWIAKETIRLLRAQPYYSMGIITFYVAQREEILRQMKGEGLVEQVPGRGLQIVDEWREFTAPNGEIVERLRVGTVDAFQGKEFDVVLLSVTRSNTVKAVNQALIRRKYGFLSLENRLVVAMSRQKRLLIVVGDSDMVLEALAEEAIPGLRRFYELCEGRHGLLL